MTDTNTTIENENTSPNRPNRYDLAVRQVAAEKAWPEFRAWLIANDATEAEADTDREDVLPELADALEWSESGYDVAQHLEHKGWDADDGLVDAARRLIDALDVAHDAAVKAWVTATKPAQRFAVGDAVQFTHSGRPGRPTTGEVTRIDAARAKYVVFCASLGHVREGVGSHGTLVNFEDARPVATVPAPCDP